MTTVHRMPKAWLAASAVLVGSFLGLAGCSSSASSASCVAPQLVAAPSQISAGHPVVLHGTYFLSDCGDTGGTSKVMPELSLYGTGASLPSRVELGRATPAGKHGEFKVSVIIPTAAHGTLTIKAEGYATATVTVSAPAS